ncbi:MAG TPA: hypothetical protein VH560_00155 [Polyangia bacterium]|jgi:hypothetical protein|nr:hypothetical protein [Polyangia bacterium]
MRSAARASTRRWRTSRGHDGEHCAREHQTTTPGHLRRRFAVDPAIVEDEHTVFSACMLEVLRGGIPGKKARFSLSTLAAEVKVRVQTINQRRAQQGKICAPSPELHVPRQEHGDISLLPFFPNHAHPSLRQPDTPPPPRASRPRDPKKQKGSPDFGYGDFSKDDARSEEDVYVETPSTRLFLESGGRHSVIAGAKGTGKSLLLFKRMTQARKAQGALVLPAKGAIAFVPSDALAALLSREYYQLWTAEGRPRIGAWTACWASALQMTVVRAWRDHAQQHGDRDQLNLLRTVSGALIQGAAEQNPYALLERILEAVEDGGLNVLRGSRVLSDFITKHARAFPPVHMFLDNGDEVFEGNPRFWIASSMSCFIAMTHLCSNAGNRVHFTMTLRPDVIWELRRDSNFPRWDADILHLTWPRDMLYELFIQRIRTLRPDCLATPDLRQTAPLTALLGADLLRDGKVVIRDKRVETDPAQAVYVDAFEFILRNTLRRPRDLVQVGNELVRSLQQRGGELTHPRRVREAIDEARSKIAQAYVHEIAHRWPWGADHDDPMSLGRFLTRLPCNLLSRADVERIDADFAARAGAATGAVSPIEVLASVGLIGYVDEGSEGPIQRFARVGESTVVHLPQVDWYLVNPVLYGPPYHVKAVRGLQVGRDLPFNLAQIPAGFVR